MPSRLAPLGDHAVVEPVANERPAQVALVLERCLEIEEAADDARDADERGRLDEGLLELGDDEAARVELGVKERVGNGLWWYGGGGRETGMRVEGVLEAVWEPRLAVAERGGSEERDEGGCGLWGGRGEGERAQEGRDGVWL